MLRSAFRKSFLILKDKQFLLENDDSFFVDQILKIKYINLEKEKGEIYFIYERIESLLNNFFKFKEFFSRFSPFVFFVRNKDLKNLYFNNFFNFYLFFYKINYKYIKKNILKISGNDFIYYSKKHDIDLFVNLNKSFVIFIPYETKTSNKSKKVCRMSTKSMAENFLDYLIYVLMKKSKSKNIEKNFEFVEMLHETNLKEKKTKIIKTAIESILFIKLKIVDLFSKANKKHNNALKQKTISDLIMDIYNYASEEENNLKTINSLGFTKSIFNLFLYEDNKKFFISFGIFFRYHIYFSYLNKNFKYKNIKKSEFSYKKNNLFSRKDCCFQIFSYEMTIFNGEVKILLDKSVKRIFLYVSDHNSDNNPICIEDRY